MSTGTGTTRGPNGPATQPGNESYRVEGDRNTGTTIIIIDSDGPEGTGTGRSEKGSSRRGLGMWDGMQSDLAIAVAWCEETC